MRLNIKMETQTLEKRAEQSQARETQRKIAVVYKAGKIMRNVYDENGRIIASPPRDIRYRN